MLQFLGQIRGNGLGTGFRQLLIGFVAALGVGMTFHPHGRAGELPDGLNGPIHNLLTGFIEVCCTGAVFQAGQADGDAAVGILQDHGFARLKQVLGAGDAVGGFAGFRQRLAGGTALAFGGGQAAFESGNARLGVGEVGLRLGQRFLPATSASSPA